MDTVSKHTIKLGLNTTECHLAALSHGRREKRKELEKEKSLLGKGGQDDQDKVCAGDSMGRF